MIYEEIRIQKIAPLKMLLVKSNQIFTIIWNIILILIIISNCICQFLVDFLLVKLQIP